MGPFRSIGAGSALIFFLTLTSVKEGAGQSTGNGTAISSILPFDAESAIQYQLFNRNNRGGVFFYRNDTNARLLQIFVPGLRCKVITHGWLNELSYNYDMIEAYLRNEEVNAVAVGWGDLAMTGYLEASALTSVVGSSTGAMVVKMVRAGVTSLNETHLVGFNLGAHVVGVAGRYVRGVLGLLARITALDPASPLFELGRTDSMRLSKDDARFVDVIHTCRVSVTLRLLATPTSSLTEVSAASLGVPSATSAAAIEEPGICFD